MIGIRQAPQFFFDRPKVKDAVNRATRKVLSKFGAFVRTAARHSIKKRKATAPPGTPPSSHTGLLKKFIFFGYDRDKDSVVIGPAKLKNKTDAPQVLEYGGDTTLELGKKRRKERVHIAARPFMGPAFEEEVPKLPAMWRDSVR